MTGTLGILNVGAGDTKIVFDRDNPDETERAAGMVRTLMSAGFVIMVDAGDTDVQGRPVMTRVRDFDSRDRCYIVLDRTPDEPRDQESSPQVDAPKARRGAHTHKTKRIPASEARATAIPRTSGG